MNIKITGLLRSMLTLAVLFLASCGGSSGGGSSGAVTPAPEITSWAYLDSTTINGINKNVAQTAVAPQLTVLGSKLYATWNENNGTASQIRVAVYNGNDAAPAWTFVDGGGTNGINKNGAQGAFAPQLTVLGSKLYATWQESNGTTDQIRMAVYNGIDTAPVWASVDGNGTNGINKYVALNAFAPQLTVLGSKLYATWGEYTGAGATQIRMAVYNGNDGAPAWTFVDGGGTNGINKNVALSAYAPQLTVLGSKLYATWYEFNVTASQIRMAVYNGNDAAPTWTAVDGNLTDGINKSGAQGATDPQLTVLGSKLYATWNEYNGTDYQIRMAVYNGNDAAPTWASVDGNGTNGINKNAAQTATAPQLTVLGSKLYATWYENNGTAYQIRMAVYNGNDAASAWAFVDGGGTNGINKNVAQYADVPQLTVLGSKLYSTWYEYNGTANQIRIAVGQ
jgi:hypothetical protein